MTECSVGVKPFRGKAEMTGNVSDDRSEFGHQVGEVSRLHEQNE